MPSKLTVRRPSDFVEFRKESILQGIHERFEEVVRRHPATVALKTRETAWTYAQTNGFANSIAAEILSLTGKKMAQVCLLLPNTPELVLALLASLKAHKTYVPLDSNFPEERLRVMMDDADPAVLLTDDEHMSLAKQLAGNVRRIINISHIKRSADAPNPKVPCDPLDPAYILYTSGSTGRPKGIVFLHRNLLHTTMCLTNELFFSPSDRVTWLHSPSFGSSVVDFYCSLTNGATLCPWDTKTQGFTGMADWLVREKVTTLQWIPSAFRQFMRTVPAGMVFQDMRIIILAGEPMTVREVELFRRNFPRGSHLVNQVGTGESYNYHLYRVDHDIPIENANVSGGYPVSADRQVLILDDEKCELPRGSIGEIAIRSDYMSGGYWRDEKLTQSKFVRLGADPTPAYLTGDLGKLDEDGCLTHLGRKDFQVKIRGCRIEVAEVEHFLTSAPGVADSAVWLAKTRQGEDQLVGYVVLKEPGKFDPKPIERHLESQLPDFMVPRRYVVLQSLPTLPTGKVDRKGLAAYYLKEHPQDAWDKLDKNALPAADEAGSIPTNRPVAGRTPTEKLLVEIWQEVLGCKEVGITDDFFDLGGDSLHAAVVLHLIHLRCKVELGYSALLQAPRIVDIVSLIEQARAESLGKFVGGASEKRRPFSENIFRGALNRFCQVLALYAPGITTFRPWLHRLRGVRMGRNIHIGTAAIIETARPELICMGNDVAIGIRNVIIGHFSDSIDRNRTSGEPTVRIGNNVFMGCSVTILPNVTIGDGAVISAGSVVTKSVPPRTMVRGNPAVPVAICEVPLVGGNVTYEEFLRHLKPLANSEPAKE
jgi:amino acid adenylation domain-containing protein